MKVIFEGRVYEIVRTEKGYVVPKPFMIIDRNFVPVGNVSVYEAEVLKKIIDKRGKEVPILRLKSHVHNVCGERCICGEFIYHEFEKKVKIDDDFEDEVRKCKKCGYTERNAIKHDFVLESDKLELVCDRCGFKREVKNVKEIKECAIPPFPLKILLLLYNLTIEKIEKLKNEIEELIKRRPVYPIMDKKLERSYDLWKGTEFYKYKELVQIATGVMYQQQCDEPDDIWIDGNKVYVGFSNDSTIMGEVVETFYKKEIIKEFSTKEELLNAFNIYDEEETKRLKAEYDIGYDGYYKRLSEWEKEFNEKIINSNEYKNLRDFMTSKYGIKICYKVDPHEGYFGGIAIPPRDICEVFFEGLEKLGIEYEKEVDISSFPEKLKHYLFKEIYIKED